MNDELLSLDLIGLSGKRVIKCVAYRIGAGTKGSDSIVINIRGVVPIPLR